MIFQLCLNIKLCFYSFKFEDSPVKTMWPNEIVSKTNLLNKMDCFHYLTDLKQLIRSPRASLKHARVNLFFFFID